MLLVRLLVRTSYLLSVAVADGHNRCGIQAQGLIRIQVVAAPLDILTTGGPEEDVGVRTTPGSFVAGCVIQFSAVEFTTIHSPSLHGCGQAFGTRGHFALDRGVEDRLTHVVEQNDIPHQSRVAGEFQTALDVVDFSITSSETDAVGCGCGFGALVGFGRGLGAFFNAARECGGDGQDGGQSDELFHDGFLSVAGVEVEGFRQVLAFEHRTVQLFTGAVIASHQISAGLLKASEFDPDSIGFGASAVSQQGSLTLDICHTTLKSSIEVLEHLIVVDNVLGAQGFAQDAARCADNTDRGAHKAQDDNQCHDTQ